MVVIVTSIALASMYNPASFFGLMHFIISWLVTLLLLMVIIGAMGLLCYGSFNNLVSLPTVRQQAYDRGREKAAEDILEISSVVQNST